MTTKEIIKRNDTRLFDNLDCKRIDMYYSGWECDSRAWIFKDGRMFGTNHGTVCEISRHEFTYYKNELRLYLEELDSLLNTNKIYEVTFESKDGSLYKYSTSQPTEFDAIEKTRNILIEKDWLHKYGYKFKESKLI